MPNEVVTKEDYQLITDEDFDFIIKVDELVKRYKVMMDKYKNGGEEFLEQRGEDSYKQTKDGVTVCIYKTKPYKKKQVDVQALKDQGLYEEFAKDTWVKGSVRIQVEYSDD